VSHMRTTPEPRPLPTRPRPGPPRPVERPVRLELHTRIGVFLAEVPAHEAEAYLADFNTGFSATIRVRDRRQGDVFAIARDHLIGMRVVDA